MTLNCEKVKEAIISSLGQSFECIPVAQYLIVNTPFTYPNLDTVQVYVETLPSGEVVLSDKGETLRYLASYMIDPEDGSHKERVLRAITTSFGTEYKKGVFYKSSDGIRFGADILNMVNTMIRVSDLQLTQKVRQPRNDFYLEVEELVREIAPTKEEVEKKTVFEGNSGKRYHATYFLKKQSAILEPLAHPIQAVDWTKVATVFQEFYDLKNNPSLAGYNFYTILDDEDSDWPEEPKILLSDVSSILLWSRRRQWKEALKAA